MSARRIVAGVVLLAIGVGLGVGLMLAITGDDDGDDGRASDGTLPTATTTTEPTRPDEATNPEAAELYDTVIAFTERTVYAKYRVEVAARPDATSIIEVWQKDGKLRQDAIVEDPEKGEGRLAVLDLGDRVVLCQQPPAGQFSCGLVSEEQATTYEQLRVGLLADLEDQEITARDETVEGRDLRCFTVELAEASELCVTESGVLARISGPQGNFELLETSDEVDDSVFVPPAEPGAGAPS